MDNTVGVDSMKRDVQGGVIEQKTIGINIGTEGTFSNTELIDSKIQLRIEKQSPLEYFKVGTWTSNIVDIGDNFKDYGKVIISSTGDTTTKIKTFTRSSSDGVNFGQWMELTEDGYINSLKNRYIQVRIELHAGSILTTVILTNDSYIENNSFTENKENVLQLKRDYQFDMSLDSSWVDTGSLHRYKIDRREWLKIDRMEVDNIE